MDGGSHVLASMLLMTAIGGDGCLFGHLTQFNGRLLSKSHRLARAIYKQTLRTAA